MKACMYVDLMIQCLNPVYMLVNTVEFNPPCDVQYTRKKGESNFWNPSPG